MQVSLPFMWHFLWGVAELTSDLQGGVLTRFTAEDFSAHAASLSPHTASQGAPSAKHAFKGGLQFETFTLHPTGVAICLEGRNPGPSWTASEPGLCPVCSSVLSPPQPSLSGTDVSLPAVGVGVLRPIRALATPHVPVVHSE